MFSLMVALSNNKVIGKDKDLPWYIPSDLKNFRKVTSGKTVIMGRKTFESIGKPLPNRYNIVISSNTEEMSKKYSNFTSDQFCIVKSLNLAKELCITLSGLKIHNPLFEEFVFIGGETVYKEALSFVDKMYITRVDTECSGDTFFPDYNQNEWKVVCKEVVTDEKSYLKEDLNKQPLMYTFETLERIK